MLYFKGWTQSARRIAMNAAISALLCVLCAPCVLSQSIGINTSTPHSSSLLDLRSNTKGLLIPRTSTVTRTAIADPAKGLFIYDTTTSALWFFSGIEWMENATKKNTWGLTGNANTTSADFIGTTDTRPLYFRIKNERSGVIDSSSFNTGIGFKTLSFTTGINNTSIGFKSLTTNTTGEGNTAAGMEVLRSNTTGNWNTATGISALYSNTSGSLNTAMGTNAMWHNLTGTRNVAIGLNALNKNTSGINNTSIGSNSLFNNLTGEGNAATGLDALTSNTTGNWNTAAGTSALYSNISGSLNTAMGVNAMWHNLTGDRNVAIGLNALNQNTTGYNNTAIGANTLYQNKTGFSNIAVGVYALAESVGNRNVAIGDSALAKTTGGFFNTGIGSAVMRNNTSGLFNTAVGHVAMSQTTTGSFNTAIGTNALYNNITGNFNIAIGFDSGVDPAFPNLYNNIGLGNNGWLSGDNNQVLIGNHSTGYIGGHAPWSSTSDERMKRNILHDIKGLDFIMKLEPVSYYVSVDKMTEISGNQKTPDFPGKYDIEKIKQTGFLAQQVEKAAQETGFEFSGVHKMKSGKEMYSLSYSTFVVPLVKAMQEQQQQIEELKKIVEELRSKIK